MASMIEITCKCGCGKKRMVRSADVKRGWGLFYNKACKAREQERRTRQNKNYHNSINNDYRGSGVSREKFMRYAKEHGGIPQFNHNGRYIGLCMSPVDMSEGNVQ